MDFCSIFIKFILYSILGWIYETIFCSITSKKWDNRGMLFGPYCPIYGIGSILCAFVCLNIKSGIQVFFICMIGSAFLELSTAFITEKLFHTVWWDYTDFPLNYKGIICLPASLAFGGAGLLVKYILEPIMVGIIFSIPVFLVQPIAMILMAIFAADIAITVDCLVALHKKIQNAALSLDSKISNTYDNFVMAIDSSTSNAIETIKNTISKENIKQDIIEQESSNIKPTLNWKQIKLLSILRTINIKTKKGSILNYKDILNRLKTQIKK